jgi:hypothetical protein
MNRGPASVYPSPGKEVSFLGREEKGLSKITDYFKKGLTIFS